MILDILNIGSKVIDKIWPDKDEAEKAKIRLLELQRLWKYHCTQGFGKEAYARSAMLS